jgi:hypothetical protein
VNGKVMKIVSSSQGAVFYADVERALTDAVKIDDAEHDWLPGNQTAEKLWRCVESFRDLQNHLEDAHHLKESAKRRRLKTLLTPLHSLAIGVLDLLNECESNPEIAKKIKKETKLVSQLRKLLLAQVPIGKDEANKDRLLSKLRHTTSAHIDKSLSADEARQLIANLKSHEVGLWLHVCITVFSDLLKLPIYFWTCKSEKPDVFHIMMCEPFLISMRIKDEESLEIVDTHIMMKSPRNEITEIVFSVIEYSRWMFRPRDKQIQKISYDKDGDSWAQSLKNLAKI